jgi:GTPase
MMPQGDKAASYVVGLPEAGNTVGIKKGVTEWAVNVGKLTYREILVELKNS